MRKLVAILDDSDVPYMIIGGYALPAYGRIRATQDLDVAIAASISEVERLHTTLRERDFMIPQAPQEEASMYFLLDQENSAEIEIYTEPDGVIWNKELLERRIRVHPFNDDFEAFVIGPEDFIINKLAREDRAAQNEDDVVSVLRMQEGKLDYRYLTRRARQAGVWGLLQTLIGAISQTGE